MDIKICKLAGSGGEHLPTWAAGTGRAQVQGQPGVSTKSAQVRPCLKIKI